MSFSGKGKKLGKGNNDDMGIIARLSRAVSDSPVTKSAKGVADDAAYVTKKLIKSTGKAAWYAGTTLLIFGLPLMLATERELILNEQELQQQSLLG